VRADKDRIQQVIENLIVNSIKYGNEWYHWSGGG
jgi:signal transduction histidine kinase